MAFGAIEYISVIESVQAIGCEGVVFVNQQATIGVLIGDVHVIGIITGVAMQHHAAATGCDLLGKGIYTQTPGGHIQIVDSIIANFTIRIIAKHPPGSVETMLVECMFGGRAKPAVIIDAAWWLAVRNGFDGASRFGCPGAGDFDVADNSLF